MNRFQRDQGAGQVAAIFGCAFEVMRPALFKTKLLARLSFDNAAEVLHIRIVPVLGSPVILLDCPSEEKEMYDKFPFITMPGVRAGEVVVMTSPVSTAALVPLRVVSIKEIQPCSQPPELAHVAPSALIQTVTRLPTLMASDRARASVESKSFLADVRRVDAIIAWKLGMATAIKIAKIAIVIINSISVKPLDLKFA